MSDAAGTTYYHDTNYISMNDTTELDASQFGYRVVSPGTAARCYTTTIMSPDSSSNQHNNHSSSSSSSMDYYNESTMTGDCMNHTLGTQMEMMDSTATIFSTSMPNMMDVLQAQQEWDEVLTSPVQQLLNQDMDDAYLSDCEEMEEHWDIDAGVNMTGNQAVDEEDLALE